MILRRQKRKFKPLVTHFSFPYKYSESLSTIHNVLKLTIQKLCSVYILYLHRRFLLKRKEKENEKEFTIVIGFKIKTQRFIHRDCGDVI